MKNFSETITQLTTRSLPLDQLSIETDRVKQAAVTLLLRETHQAAEILIIKRAERLGDPWSGHLALPGGRADATDANLMVTAARETREEVGIVLDNDEHFIGRLETLLPQSPRLPQIEISPLIAVAPQSTALILNHEVADAFWWPVQTLLETGLSEIYRFPLGNSIIKYPAYPSTHGLIWGITERILTDFLKLLQA